MVEIDTSLPPLEQLQKLIHDTNVANLVGMVRTMTDIYFTEGFLSTLSDKKLEELMQALEVIDNELYRLDVNGE